MYHYLEFFFYYSSKMIHTCLSSSCNHLYFHQIFYVITYHNSIFTSILVHSFNRFRMPVSPIKVRPVLKFKLHFYKKLLENNIFYIEIWHLLMSNQMDEQHRGQVAFYVSLENQTFQSCPAEHRPKINVSHHSQLLIH